MKIISFFHKICLNLLLLFPTKFSIPNKLFQCQRESKIAEPTALKPLQCQTLIEVAGNFPVKMFEDIY